MLVPDGKAWTYVPDVKSSTYVPDVKARSKGPWFKDKDIYLLF